MHGSTSRQGILTLMLLTEQVDLIGTLILKTLQVSFIEERAFNTYSTQINAVCQFY